MAGTSCYTVMPGVWQADKYSFNGLFPSRVNATLTQLGDALEGMGSETTQLMKTIVALSGQVLKDNHRVVGEQVVGSNVPDDWACGTEANPDYANFDHYVMSGTPFLGREKADW